MERATPKSNEKARLDATKAEEFEIKVKEGYFKENPKHASGLPWSTHRLTVQPRVGTSCIGAYMVPKCMGTYVVPKYRSELHASLHIEHLPYKGNTL